MALPGKAADRSGHHDGREAAVVLARHRNIDVVVPWDEAVVPDRAEQRPVGEVIPETVRDAQRFEVAQDLELRELELAQNRSALAVNHEGEASLGGAGPPSRLDLGMEAGERPDHDGIVIAMDCESAGLDHALENEAETDELSLKLLPPDETTVVLVMNERVTTGGFATPIERPQHGSRFNEQLAVRSKIPGRPAEGDRGDVRRDGMEHEAHVDGIHLARVPIVEPVHRPPDKRRSMPEVGAIDARSNLINCHVGLVARRDAQTVSCHVQRVATVARPDLEDVGAGRQKSDAFPGK
jgi:hypothetical protein